MFSSAVLALFGLSGALATPIEKRAPPAGVNDTVILQYALTLEHLENNFYSGALAKYDANAFAQAGYPAWVRNRFVQVGGDEASHVALLTAALGSSAVAPCTYSFPYTDVKSFVALAGVIENVGVSAYLGAAADISNTAYITVAGSILTTEARHQAWINSAVEKANPWSTPYDTPLRYNGVYTIAAQFIKSCPSSNAALPFTPFGSLTASSTTPGQKVQLTYNDTTTTQKYLIVYYGLSVTAVNIAQDKTVTLPSNLQGTSYAVVSSSNNVTMVAPSTVIAGPLILVNPFVSSATSPSPATAGQPGMAT